MDRSVLIVSDMDDDLHAAAIRSELQKRGESVICFDPGTILDNEVEFIITRSTEVSCRVKAIDTEFTADSVKSVLYRRPTPIPENEHVEADYRRIVRDEWIAFTMGLWEILNRADCLWVSHPANIKRAESKLWQLETAAALGLTVPKTIITNNADQLKKFHAQVKTQLVMKKLRTHCIVSGAHSAIFVTTLLKDLSDISASDLTLCPVIFQEFIPKLFDVRLVVVGEKTFAVKIHSQSFETTKIDYRAGKEQTQALLHEQYDPPPNVSKACVAMARDFGLRFGAFDFVITPSGEHIFLELNPNGQWLWLELSAKAPISNALCEILAHPVHLGSFGSRSPQ